MTGKVVTAWDPDTHFFHSRCCSFRLEDVYWLRKDYVRRRFVNGRDVGEIKLIANIAGKKRRRTTRTKIQLQRSRRSWDHPPNRCFDKNIDIWTFQASWTLDGGNLSTAVSVPAVFDQLTTPPLCYSQIKPDKKSWDSARLDLEGQAL